eukprot:PhF_6_TR6974/c0_g1_i1/m.10312
MAESLAQENVLLQKEIDMLRALMAKDPALHRSYYQHEVCDALKRTILFKGSTDEEVLAFAKHMKRYECPKGTILQRENEPIEYFTVIVEGQLRRVRMIEGVQHQITSAICSHSIGALNICEGSTAFSTAQCLTDCIVYKISKDDFNHVLSTQPQLAAHLVTRLSRMLRRSQRFVRTPLLEQQSAPASIPVTAFAAFVESFYRSAMNAWLNSKLIGGNVASLFPNMHIQSTVRIVYINGFKQLRTQFDRVPTDSFAYPDLARLLLACGPGLIMAPVSSLLEANNAGHKNPEPLIHRWRRGYIPRCGREVIFGIGLNQLTDYCEERVPRWVTNKQARNALGSMSAGVLCAYASHIPHNLSAMKLMMPQLTYAELWGQLVEQRQKDIPNRTLASMAAVVFPRGLVIRAGQIVGSFVIINGIIASWNRMNFKQTSTAPSSSPGTTPEVATAK